MGLDFLKRYGAIAMNKARERYMRMPLATLEAMRDETKAALGSLCGPAHSNAVVRLQDLEAVIGSMQYGEELRQQEERAERERKAFDEETDRRARAFVEDVRKIGIGGIAAARRMLPQMYCSSQMDQVVKAKAMALLGA